VRLFSRDEHDAIFKSGPDIGWKRFYEKYPGSPGITTVSRVGLNRPQECCPLLCGMEQRPSQWTRPAPCHDEAGWEVDRVAGLDRIELGVVVRLRARLAPRPRRSSGRSGWRTPHARA
jgi:hypothetical protein